MVRARVSAAASTAKTQPSASGSTDTAVRHGPAQAIEAPSAIEAGIVGGADRDPAQVAFARDRDHRADGADESGKHRFTSCRVRRSRPCRRRGAAPRPCGTRRPPSAAVRCGPSARRPPAVPSSAGPVTSVQASIRSARASASARRGPPSLHRRVRPRSPRSARAAVQVDPAGRIRRHGRHLDAQGLQGAAGMGRGGAGGEDQGRRVPGGPGQHAGRREPQVRIEDDPQGRAGGEARQPHGERRGRRPGRCRCRSGSRRHAPARDGPRRRPPAPVIRRRSGPAAAQKPSRVRASFRCRAGRPRVTRVTWPIWSRRRRLPHQPGLDRDAGLPQQGVAAPRHPRHPDPPRR